MPREFGNLVNERRVQRGMSLFDLGVKCNITPQTLSNIERGANCSLVKAFAVARELGINAIPVEKP
jgi:transcriptional regulator with XRE-family HTH domain